MNQSQFILATAVAMIALGTCGAGCFDRDRPDLMSREASLKIPAIKQAADQHDQRAVPELVHDLDSDDPAVRFYAIQALQRLTGQTFDYHYYDEYEQRRPAVLKWRQWLATSATSPPTTSPASSVAS